MGNTTTTTTSKKGFKSEGHVLGSGPSSPVPDSNRSVPSKTSKPATLTTPTTTTSSAFAGLLPKSKTKPPPLTPEQVEERRKKLAAAAHARDKAWEDRLNKQRTKRDEQQRALHNNNNAKLELFGSAKQPDLGPLDPEVARRQREAAERLRESGFNPYEATVASSNVARSAILMERGEEGGAGVVSPKPSSASSNGKRGTSSLKNDEEDQVAAAEEESRMMQKANEARVALLRAMDGSDAQALRRAISDAAKFDFPEDLAAARELLQVLEDNGNPLEGAEEEEEAYDAEAAGGDDELGILSEVIASLKLEPDANQKGTLVTLRTLLKNLVEHPEEAKYRRINTSNKTISEKIVSACNGKAILVLESVGFRKEENEGKESYAVPDPATLPAEVVATARKRCEHALNLLG